MTIKERYQQFRQWQKNPVKYKRCNEVHQCVNCEDEFVGDYCPTCGQKWNTGPVSWKNLFQEWMGLWGLGNRSLPYTIIQLLLRPGYLIGEYISGKRRNCFPPISLLVLIALAVSLIGHWLDLNYCSEPDSARIANQDLYSHIEIFREEHMDFFILFIFLMMLLPTYLVFRYSPKHPRHTLPQGFFIQVFITIQFLLTLLPFGLICKYIGVSVENNDIYRRIFPKIVITLLFFVNYKQLFGFRIWGTIWRLVACWLLWMSSVYLFLILMILAYTTLFHGAPPTYKEGWSTDAAIFVFFLLTGVIIVISGIVFLTNLRRKRLLEKVQK